MKIFQIYIRDFDQFQDVELDFTEPKTGQPVEKICFIGRNGTGKSKILRLINWFFDSGLGNLKDSSKFLPPPGSQRNNSRIIFKILHKGEQLYVFYFYGNVEILKSQEPK